MEVLNWTLVVIGIVGIPVALAAIPYYEWLDYACIVINIIVCIIITQQLLEYIVSLATSKREKILQVSPQYKKITIIIPAYLPNEKDIIFDTLASYENLNYQGMAGNMFNVILAYNTPHDMQETEDKLVAYQEKNSGWLTVYKVQGSHTKAQNLNYVLQNPEGIKSERPKGDGDSILPTGSSELSTSESLTDPTSSETLGTNSRRGFDSLPDQSNFVPGVINDIVGIFDADHHPYPDTLYRANYWIVDRGYDFVQGRCKVRPNTSTLSNLVSMSFDLMYCIQHQYRKITFDLAIFGGSNGFWKKELLTMVQFDPRRLTEDIDCSVRAIRLGARGTYDTHMISSEASPPTVGALFNQRVRWAQGWFEVSLAHFGTFFTAPRYNCWQRFCLVNLFIIRELWSHITLLCLPFFIAKIIWLGSYPNDVFGGITLAYAITTYPFMVIVGYISSYELYHKRWYLIPISILASVLWIYFEQIIMMRAKVRHVLRQNNWVVTRRT